MGKVFTFKIDPGPTENPGQSLCEIKRGRPAYIRFSEMVQLFLERPVFFGSIIGCFEFIESRNERLWSKPAPVIPKIAFSVR
jgi:hypothetical protein